MIKLCRRGSPTSYGARRARAPAQRRNDGRARHGDQRLRGAAAAVVRARSPDAAHRSGRERAADRIGNHPTARPVAGRRVRREGLLPHRRPRHLRGAVRARDREVQRGPSDAPRGCTARLRRPLHRGRGRDAGARCWDESGSRRPRRPTILPRAAERAETPSRSCCRPWASTGPRPRAWPGTRSCSRRSRPRWGSRTGNRRPSGRR